MQDPIYNILKRLTALNENPMDTLESEVTQEETLLPVASRKSLSDYLRSVEHDHKDTGDLPPPAKMRDISKRPTSRDLKPRSLQVEYTNIPPVGPKPPDIPVPKINRTQAAPLEEDTPVHRITMEDGRQISIHGDESNGFEVRAGERQLKSRFGKLGHAVMACELFRNKQNRNQDYIDEC